MAELGRRNRYPHDRDVPLTERNNMLGLGLGLGASRGRRVNPELWNTGDVTSSGIWTESGGVWTKGSTGGAELGLTTLAPSTLYDVQFTITAITGTLNIWRRNAGDTTNEQAESSLGSGAYSFRVLSGPGTNSLGHYLWFNGSSFTGDLSDISFRAAG